MPGTIRIIICCEDFTVNSISNNASYDPWEVPTITYNSSWNCYKRNAGSSSWICHDDTLICNAFNSFYVSGYTASSSLVSNLFLYLLQNYVYINTIDPIFTEMIKKCTDFYFNHVLFNLIKNRPAIPTTNITLSIGQLEDMPTDSDLQNAIRSVFPWVRVLLPAVDMPIDNLFVP